MCRILGNELPPRDAMWGRYRSLEYALEHESIDDVDVYWVINKVVDDHLRRSYRRLLELHRKNIWEIPFDPDEYRKATNLREKILAVIGINEVRNSLIRKLHDLGHEWAFVMDGDLMWMRDDWEAVKRVAVNEPVWEYITVPIRRTRIGEGSTKDAKLHITSELSECQIAFHKNSRMRYDGRQVFGNQEKQVLLRRLGHSIMGYENQAKTAHDSKTRCCSQVLHLDTGDPTVEADINTRVSARKESLERFCAHLDKLMEETNERRERSPTTAG